jgi:hypothetical protein
MTSGSKTLTISAVALTAALTVLLAPHLRSQTVAANGPNTGTTVIHKSAPGIEAMKIVPADVLAMGDVRWAPLTGEQ